MEIFYASEINSSSVTLSPEESQHCIKVLRHRPGDSICVIDGEGTMYECSVLGADPKGATATITATFKNWGAHPYKFTLAVCPTKNIDRLEWAAEKCTEIGLDCIAPVVGDHSERKVYNAERLGRILLSATKQSLKGAIPSIHSQCTVKDFIKERAGVGLNLIACCFEDSLHPRISIKAALEQSSEQDISVLIGPEGDFSAEEVRLAIESGFVPVHLGESRLRTETAAVTAAEAIYFKYI